MKNSIRRLTPLFLIIVLLYNLLGQAAFHASAAPPLDLTNQLVSYWPLDELDGTRVDAYSTNDLSDINLVTWSAGKINNAAQFASNLSQNLGIADNPSLSVSNGD